MKVRSKFGGRDLAPIALFAALIAAGAFIRIPVPPVPVTLQLFFVTLACALLGGGRAFAAVCVYIALGLLGVPVFTGGGGLQYVLTPTFGYIVGFAVGALVGGRIARSARAPGLGRLLLAFAVTDAIVYLFGLTHYFLIAGVYLGGEVTAYTLFVSCFALFLPGDCAQCLLSAMIARRAIPLLDRGSRT